MAVADKADYVVGVEEIGPAVEDAKINAEANHKGNIDFLEGDVDRILVGLKEKGLSKLTRSSWTRPARVCCRRFWPGSRPSIPNASFMFPATLPP